jgi:hypothetical protein
MDEWLFLSLTKTKADAPNVKYSKTREDQALTKIDTATALDYAALAERPVFRGAVAVAATLLINAAFLGAIEQTTWDARTPAGEVIVSELEPPSLAAYAQAQSPAVAF